jgi:hypothetical protein
LSPIPKREAYPVPLPPEGGPELLGAFWVACFWTDNSASSNADRRIQIPNNLPPSQQLFTLISGSSCTVTLFDPSAGFLRQPMQVYLLHFVQSTADIGVGCEPLAKGIYALMWNSAPPTDKRARHVGSRQARELKRWYSCCRSRKLPSVSSDVPAILRSILWTPFVISPTPAIFSIEWILCLIPC